MSRRPWRFRSGSIACLVWSFVVGALLSTLHATDLYIDFGNPLRTTILFAVSNVLIYWLFARPQPSSVRIVDAEIIPDDEILTPFRQDEP